MLLCIMYYMLCYVDLAIENICQQEGMCSFMPNANAITRLFLVVIEITSNSFVFVVRSQGVDD